MTGQGESQHPEPLPISRFLGVLSIEGPDRPLPYGGRVQVLSVERYDARVAVTWRLAPIPDPVEQHTLAMSALDRDTVGLTEEERKVLRDQLVGRLVSPGVWDVSLSDDLGTKYKSCGGGSSGGGQERVGRAEFVPALPDAATALTVHWGALDFPVRLT